MVGNVIKLDGNTAHGLVGHFARALVEIDLSAPLIHTVRVGLAENLFYVDFKYEEIPVLCNFCHFVGHSVDKCRRAKAAAGEEQPDAEVVTKPRGRRNRIRKNRKWVAKTKDTEVQKIVKVAEEDPVPPKELETGHDIPMSNQFSALHIEEYEEEVIPEMPLESPRAHIPSPSTHVVAAEQLGDRQPDPPHHAPSRSEQNSQVPTQVNKYDPGIPRSKLEELARRLEKSKTEVVISSKTVGQPKSSLAPNSPHPSHAQLEHKLRAASELGAQITAYDLDPGDRRRAAAMDNVAHASWADMAEQTDRDPHSDDDDTEGSLEGSPAATNLSS